MESNSASPTGPFAALLLAVLSFSLLQTMVVPALPDLGRELDATPAATAWVISSFLLTSSVGTVVIGRLGDLFGKRRLLLVSLTLLAAGTLLAALSGSIGVLVAARAVQGLGAGTFPLAFGIVRATFPRDRVPVAIGTISAIFGIGFGVGLVVPGPITDTLGWPWLFWTALAVILLALAAVAAFVPHDRGRGGGRVDWPGGIVLTVALVSLLLAISQSRQWATPVVVALGTASVVAFAGFAVLETRLTSPLIDLRMLRRRTLVTANLTALIIGFGMYGAFTLVPQLVQTPVTAGYGFGATVTESGLYLLPMAVTMLFAGPAAGRLGARLGFTPTLVLACVVGAAGFTFFAAGHRHAWAIAVGAGVLGVGIGFAFSALANVVVAAVGPHETGEATGVNTIVRTVGGSLGAQAAITIVATDLPAVSGYTTAFTLSAIALLIAALVASTARSRTARRSQEAAEGASPAASQGALGETARETSAEAARGTSEEVPQETSQGPSQTTGTEAAR
ncbi:MFS transporter [Streptosporangium saharense]|uniref:EmrB/QacA subfamily drug resistance transporter n=1 Tax=Streptosporangium saharense TaxID=1706840 RepID=A0A7W7VM76_9ACTN|nr:MFS transporter [Streptosporangium saharense]MBB4915343.1 EmrB/QacA subfamily drug resistance transporter [Streptosporangium saharense]